MARADVPETSRRFPGLRLVPGEAPLILTGGIEFYAQAPGGQPIRDCYGVRITVPLRFPAQVPRVWNTDRRIPPGFHRLKDGSFCLGSPVRLRLLLGHAYTLPKFIDRCAIPYLYGFSHWERHGVMPFGELDHGFGALVEDYERLFDVSGPEAVISMLVLIGLPRRVANKHSCPCGSGRRLGRCHHKIVNTLRRPLGRRWCRGEAAYLLRHVEIDREMFLNNQKRRRVLRGRATDTCSGLDRPS